MAEELHVEEHESLIKTPRQLVTVVVLAFAVPIALIVLISQYVTGGLQGDPASMTEDAIARRIKPVGTVVLGEAPPAPPAAAAGGATAKVAAGPVDGKAVFEKNCNACHAAGVMGAPKVGDRGDWAPRIAQGTNTLYEHAIKGIRGMPAKGGNASLSDDEVKAAVDYVVGLAK
jgi:cytochrome c5